MLGGTPVKKRLFQFLVGFLFVVLIKLLMIFIGTQVKSIDWQYNTGFEINMLFMAAWYHLKSALTEDLVFRGAILFIVIQRLGVQKGLLISSIVFGAYHWFSYGLIENGQLVPLFYVLVVTGLSGYVWGQSFVYTKSIAMPLGFHLGWNLTSSLFYESQPYGELLFRAQSIAELTEWNRFYFALFDGIAPSLITLAFVYYFHFAENTKKLDRTKKSEL